MNVRLFLSIRGRALLLALLCGWWLTATSVRADEKANAETNQATLAAAQNWLTEIDAGEYEKSYSEGCTAFHNKVSQDQWITVLKALRPSIGTVISRKLISQNYKPDGFEGLNGECMVNMYATTFSKLGPTLEVVVLKREDGTWRGAGYNAQPQQGAQPSQEPQSPQSEPLGP
jgi:hypothetical protein